MIICGDDCDCCGVAAVMLQLNLYAPNVFESCTIYFSFFIVLGHLIVDVGDEVILLYARMPVSLAMMGIVR